MQGNTDKPFTLDDIVECEAAAEVTEEEEETNDEAAGAQDEGMIQYFVDSCRNAWCVAILVSASLITNPYLDMMKTIPELAALGEIFR